MDDFKIAEQIILERSKRRGLNVNLNKMKYLSKSLFANLHYTPKSSLIIGIGHGHNILVMMLMGLLDEVVGVDPYISSAGNDDIDYKLLIETSKQLELQNKLTIHKTTIQDFLLNNKFEKKKKYDFIYAADVFHHIFVTEEKLSESNVYDESIELFAKLKGMLNIGRCFVLDEVERRGAMPLLVTSGVTKWQIDYTTKQSYREWEKSAKAGGFVLCNMNVYVPYRLRKFKFLLNNRFALYTLCNRFFLSFR